MKTKLRENKKYPEGHFFAIGMLLFGIPFGISISIALDNFAFIGAGIGIGVAIGAALEEKYKKQGKIRKLKKDEKKNKKNFVLISLLILGALFLFGIIVTILLSK